MGKITNARVKKGIKPDTIDGTTRARFALEFSAEDHIRDVSNLDCSIRMTPTVRAGVEILVQKWLDCEGIESPQISVDLYPKDKQGKVKTIYFARAEIAFKTASNCWLIMHVAQSAFWPRLISSKPKLVLQHPGSYMIMDNEVKSCNYGVYEGKISLAEKIKENKR